MKKYFIIFIVLFASLTTYGAWRIPSLLIFKTDPKSNVYLPGFYPPNELTQLKFTNASTNFIPKPVTSTTASNIGSRPDTAPIFQKDGLALYQLAPSSLFCQKHKEVCVSGQRGIFVLSGKTKNGFITTSSYALLDEEFTSLSQVRYLLNEGSSTQSLFIVRDGNKKHDIKEIEQKNNKFYLNLNIYKKIDVRFVLYAFLLSFLLSLLLCNITIRDFIVFFSNTYKESKIYLLILLSWLFLSYISVFPFIEGGDVIFSWVNKQYYTDWYSDLYFIYTSMVRLIGFKWIQLPSVLISGLSIIFVIKILSLSLKKFPPFLKNLFLSSCLFLILINPAVFVAIFAQQRTFLAINVLFLSIAICYYLYVRYLHDGRRVSIKEAVFIEILFGTSWLLRPEYFLFFLASIILLITFAITAQEDKTTYKNKIPKIILTALLVISVKLILPIYMAKTYHYDRKTASFKYKAISYLEMGYPYLCPHIQDTGLAQSIEYFGKVETFCSKNSDIFWYKYMNWTNNFQISTEMKSVNSHIYDAIIHNWHILAIDKIRTGSDILHADVYPLTGMYALRDDIYHQRISERQKEYGVYGFSIIADKFWNIKEDKLFEETNRKEMDFYGSLNHNISWVFFWEIFILSIVLIFYGWSWLSVLITAIFFSFIPPIVFMAPAKLWWYLAFIPVWGSFLPPLALAEALVTKQYFREHAPTGRLATLFLRVQKFCRFAGLSGGCWAMDVAVLFLLHHLGHWPLFLSNMLSSSLAAGTVFLISSRFIHDGCQNHGKKRVIAYLTYNLVVIAAVSTVLPLLTRWIMGTDISNMIGGYSFLLAKIIVTPPQLVLNFFVSRFVARYNVQPSK